MTIITFDDIDIEKSKFHHHKSPVFQKMQIQYLTRFLLVKRNYKYFIGYSNDDYKVKPLQIMLPKTSAYVKNYNGQSKWMYFLIEDDELLEKYNTI